MGVDADIYFQAEDGFEFELDMPNGFEVMPVGGDSIICPEGATHLVNQSCRFYGEDYARGNWPMLCWALMLLHACKKVSKVWYGGDNYVTECPPQRVLEISKFFMEKGNRPYFG